MSKYPVMLEFLRAEINRRVEELEEMQALFRSIGGEIEGEEEEDEPEPPKRLPAPARRKAPERKPAARGDEVDYVLDGHTMTLSQRKVSVLKLLRSNTLPTPIDDVAGLYGGKKSLMYAELAWLKEYLGAFGFSIVNERGLGYKLETI